MGKPDKQDIIEPEEELTDRALQLKRELTEMEEEHSKLDAAAMRAGESSVGSFYRMGFLEKKMKRIRETVSDILERLAEINPMNELVRKWRSRKK